MAGRRLLDVSGYFADSEAPARMRLHFVQDPTVAVA
jgi:hypothetical protein